MLNGKQGRVVIKTLFILSVILGVSTLMAGATVVEGRFKTQRCEIRIKRPDSFPAYAAVREQYNPMESFILEAEVTPTGAAYDCEGHVAWKCSNVANGAACPDAFPMEDFGPIVEFSPKEAGKYKVKAIFSKTENGPKAEIESGEIIGFKVTIEQPAQFPAYVKAHDPDANDPQHDTLPIKAKIEPTDVAGAGSVKWSVVEEQGLDPSPFDTGGTSLFDLFTTQIPGKYILKVAYTINMGGETQTAIALTKEINCFKINITTPATYPVYITAFDPMDPNPPGDNLDLAAEIIPADIEKDGVIQWRVVNGVPDPGYFSTPQATTTSFWSEVAGDAYVIEVDFTVKGMTSTDTTGEIICFDILITNPNTYPVYIKSYEPLNPTHSDEILDLAAEITPAKIAGDGVIQWRVANGFPDPGNFSSPDATSTSFWSEVAGDTYVIEVDFTVQGVTSTDSTDEGTINVVAVEITTTPPSEVQVCGTYPLEANGEPAGGTYSWSMSEGEGDFIPIDTAYTEFVPLPILGGNFRFGVGNLIVQAEYLLEVTDADTAPTISVFPVISPDWTTWASGDTLTSNNCYNFATNIRSTTSFTSQPGRSIGLIYAPTQISCSLIISAAQADGLKLIDPNDLCGSSSLPNAHIVALVVAPGIDYHWYRLESGAFWTHKPGTTPPSNLDGCPYQPTGKKPILDPSGPDIDRCIYTDFCGYFEVTSSVHIQ